MHCAAPARGTAFNLYSPPLRKTCRLDRSAEWSVSLPINGAWLFLPSSINNTPSTAARWDGTVDYSLFVIYFMDCLWLAREREKEGNKVNDLSLSLLPLPAVPSLGYWRRSAFVCLWENRNMTSHFFFCCTNNSKETKEGGVNSAISSPDLLRVYDCPFLVFDCIRVASLITFLTPDPTRLDTMATWHTAKLGPPWKAAQSLQIRTQGVIIIPSTSHSCHQPSSFFDSVWNCSSQCRIRSLSTKAHQTNFNKKIGKNTIFNDDAGAHLFLFFFVSKG